MADSWWIYFCFYFLFLPFCSIDTSNSFDFKVRVGPLKHRGTEMQSLNFGFLLHHLSQTLCKNHFENLLKYT